MEKSVDTTIRLLGVNTALGPSSLSAKTVRPSPAWPPTSTFFTGCMPYHARCFSERSRSAGAPKSEIMLVSAAAMPAKAQHVWRQGLLNARDNLIGASRAPLVSAAEATGLISPPALRFHEATELHADAQGPRASTFLAPSSLVLPVRILLVLRIAMNKPYNAHR